MTNLDFLKQKVPLLKHDAETHARIYSPDALAIVKIIEAILFEYEKDTLKDYMESEIL